MLLFLPPRARESVLMLTWDVGTGMDGVQARAFFPFLQVLRISGSCLWFNVFNSHKNVAQSVTVRTKQL